MEVYSWENHLFLWAMAYNGYVSHNQRVLEFWLMENGPFIDDELEKWPIYRGKIIYKWPIDRGKIIYFYGPFSSIFHVLTHGKSSFPPCPTVFYHCLLIHKDDARRRSSEFTVDHRNVAAHLGILKIHGTFVGN